MDGPRGTRKQSSDLSELRCHLRSYPLVMRLLCPTLLACLGSSLSSCSSSEPAPDGPIPAGGPSVLFITLDTTRADRLGSYGHAGARTPRMDELALSGVRFDRAYSQVPLTLASHASMLSGWHPNGTGLHVNFQGAVANEVRLLPEAFRASGYRTAAFISAWVLNSEFGLDRGFDHYDDLSDRTTGSEEQVERPADEIVDSALEWLAQDPDQPFFAWLHFFDAHDPYEPPEGFRLGFDHPYDGELAFIDTQIGRVLDWLDESGLREDTLVVITGDHGESLGEHGEGTHGLLIYDWALRVPLIISGAGIEQARVVPQTVSLVDLLETIVELCGGEVAWRHEGDSLKGALLGQPYQSRPVYGESEYSLRSFGWAPLRMLVKDGWKYIEAPQPELYDLSADPAELKNLAEERPELAAELRRALAEHHAGQAVREVEEVEVEASDGAALAALGYAEGATDIETDVDIATLKNPMRMTHVARGVMRVRAMLDGDEFEAALPQVESLLEESPESDEIWSLYAEALIETRQFEQAVTAVRRSMRVRSDHPGRLVMLGDALAELGRTDEAMRAYEDSLESDPNGAQAHGRKGMLHARARQFPQALEHFQRAVELDPDANSRTNLANALFASQRFDDGLAQLELALREDPACAPAHLGRIKVLLMTRRPDEARQAAEEGLRMMPRDADFARQLLQIMNQAGAADMVARVQEHLRQIDERAVK